MAEIITGCVFIAEIKHSRFTQIRQKRTSRVLLLWRRVMEPVYLQFSSDQQHSGNQYSKTDYYHLESISSVVGALHFIMLKCVCCFLLYVNVAFTIECKRLKSLKKQKKVKLCHVSPWKHSCVYVWELYTELK